MAEGEYPAGDRTGAGLLAGAGHPGADLSRALTRDRIVIGARGVGGGKCDDL